MGKRRGGAYTGFFGQCKSLRQLSTNQSSWGTEKGSREQSAVLVVGRAAAVLLALLSASATTCSTQDSCPGECHTSPAAWGRLFCLPSWHKGHYKALGRIFPSMHLFNSAADGRLWVGDEPSAASLRSCWLWSEVPSAVGSPGTGFPILSIPSARCPSVDLSQALPDAELYEGTIQCVLCAWHLAAQGHHTMQSSVCVPQEGKRCDLKLI